MKKNMAILVLAVTSCTAIASGQGSGEPEVVSPLGKKFYAQADEKGTIAEAEKKLAADPNNIDLIIALGQAQAAVWRYRDAIATYTRGLRMNPNHALLYRHRGHRYISIRQFDKAIEDLEKGAKLDDKNYDIWYHLGLGRYQKGKFASAAEAYEKCRAVAANDDALVGVSHWLYMTYRRNKKDAEAAKVLERIRPDLKVDENRPYFNLLLFYKGLKKESEIFDPQKMTDIEIATIGYGVGNWHLYNGNREKAKEYFERIVSGKYWPAFGFISSETELVRMR